MKLPAFMVIGCELRGENMEPTPPIFADEPQDAMGAIMRRVENVMVQINTPGKVHYKHVDIKTSDRDVYIYGWVDSAKPGICDANDDCNGKKVLIAVYHCWYSFWADDMDGEGSTYRECVDESNKKDPFVKEVVTRILSKVETDMDETIAFYHLLPIIRDEGHLPYSILEEIPSEHKEWVEKYTKEILENEALAAKIREALTNY